jgi:hypothetical protein
VRRLVLALLACAAACSGEKSPSGIEEPLRVRGGAFKEGALPGSPPDGAAAAPGVTSFEAASTVIRPGQSGKSLLGRTSPDAVAVGLRFADLGTGYWVLPVDAPDPTNNGELGWEARSDFGANLPPGLHPLRVVAIDAQGRAGTQRELSVCASPSVPDNLAACDPKAAPPAAVISLSWDTHVDLDLVVVTPEGRVVDAKHPGAGDAGPRAPAIDRDSNGGCIADGTQRESLVFQEPPHGSYLVYASLFDACGHAPVHFHVSLLEPKDGRQVETIGHDGALLSAAAKGGSTLGTFACEIAFP